MLASLGAFLADSLTLEAAVVAGPASQGDGTEARAMSLAADAEAFFRAIVADRVQQPISTNAWTLRKLDPIYKPDNDEVEWERLSAVVAVRSALAQLSNLSALAPFDTNDEGFKKRLLYWTVVLTGADGRKAYFFRTFSAAAELKRKRGAALTSSNGTFTKVDEAIFVFDDQLDVFVFDDYIYVLRKRDYRRIFDQLAQVLRRARRAAAALGKLIPIANQADFEAACASDQRMADKILSIQSRPYFSQLSLAKLQPVIQQFNLTIPTDSGSGQTKVIFKSAPKDRFAILRLVDDDYLQSSMTNEQYEVNSKSRH